VFKIFDGKDFYDIDNLSTPNFKANNTQYLNGKKWEISLLFYVLDS
jgi:hypothetical protein